MEALVRNRVKTKSKQTLTMTSKPCITTDCECLKLRDFRQFLQACTTDSAATNVGMDMRSCMTRSNQETYPVTPQELRAEVLSSIWNHLSSKRCPQDFQLGLLRVAMEEVERECIGNKACDLKSGGAVAIDDDNESEALYDLIKLQKFSVNILEKLFTRLTDNVESHNLHRYAVDGALCLEQNCSCSSHAQTVSAQTYLAASVKNKPRKMEDRHCCWSCYSDVFQLKSASNQYSFYGVFDGHGGALAAAFASTQLPQLCAEQLLQADASAADRMDALKESFIKTDKLFTRKRISSGTTAVCVLHCRSIDQAAPQQLYVAWVGDSKAMLVSRNTRQQLVRPHKPDSPEERLRIESNGSGAVMFVQGHWRVNGILNVARSIGDFSVSSVIAEPDVLCVNLAPEHDFLVLGSDGLWDHASEQEIAATVYEGLAKKDNSVQELPKLLIDLAKCGDSQDNITVVIVLLREIIRINANHTDG